jgi:class 3 adenylate cyclase
MKTGKILLLIIIILGIISCNTNQKKPPMAKLGILDLRNWDFEKDGNVRLDGDWEFYWHEFLTSKDFDTVKKKKYIIVPKAWNGYKWNKKELGYDGYATFYIKILLNRNECKNRFSIKMPDQCTCFELYENDSLIGKNGKPGISKESSIPQWKPIVVEFENLLDTLNITCRVTNFDYQFGGMIYSPQLGLKNQILSAKESKGRLEYSVIVGLCIIAFLLFTLYFFRPKEKASLAFGFFLIIMALRMFVTGERIINDFIYGIDFEIVTKLEGFSWLMVPFILIYFRALFKDEYSKLLVVQSVFVSSIICLITIIFPSYINSKIIPYAQIWILILAPYMLLLQVRAIRRKREGSNLLTGGFIILTASLISEILYMNQLAPLVIPTPIGMLMFAISQMILISNRFSMALNKIENYSIDLKKEVDKKTSELEEKYRELENKNIVIEQEKDKSDKLLLNVLPEQIANRLKQGETTIADHFEEASVIFIDIADFTKLSVKSSPQMMVKMLNEIFTIFDKIAAKYGLEKIKTIGDCYMAAAGIPVPRKDHAEAIAMMALDVMSTMKEYRSEEGHEINFRIGLDCGPIVAGVIGEQKFIYDLWGDMVNTASRMETNGIIGKIQCTERFKNALTLPSPSGRGIQGENFKFIERGEIEIKGKGKMRTWFLIDN